MNVVIWMKKKFIFYGFFQSVQNHGDNAFSVTLLPCIDYKNIDYLLLHNNWLEISEKFNMDISIKKEDGICSICFENKNNCISNCDHLFCFKCIHSWLENNDDCPYCRSDIYDISNLKLIL